jgi:hypothetical protein
VRAVLMQDGAVKQLPTPFAGAKSSSEVLAAPAASAASAAEAVRIDAQRAASVPGPGPARSLSGQLNTICNEDIMRLGANHKNAGHFT